MRRSTARFLVITAAVAFGGCGFTPKADSTGGATGAANSTGTVTGTGNSTGAGNQTGAGASSGNSNPDSNCGAISQQAMMLPPDILIVQDKSGSMNQLADGSSCGQNCATMSKWAQVTTALNQVVAMTETTVNWGLKFFADNGACSATAAPSVAVGPNNANAIATAIGRTNPGGNTPTRDAVASGGTYVAGLTDPNPKYLLLATDGLPNCPAGCSLTNPSMMCTMTDNPAEDTAATAAVAGVAAMGIPVFVVGIGSTGADATLTAFANAGGVPQTGGATAFYQVNDTAQLVAALSKILGQVATCQFAIGTPPNSMTSRDFIDVFADGVKLTQGTDWDYTDANHTSITLTGTTCANVTSGAIQKVTVTFRCIVG